MVLGYGIIAVPTSIVTAQLTGANRTNVSGQACPNCGSGGHRFDAVFCRHCATKL